MSLYLYVQISNGSQNLKSYIMDVYVQLFHRLKSAFNLSHKSKLLWKLFMNLPITSHSKNPIASGCTWSDFLCTHLQESEFTLAFLD